MPIAFAISFFVFVGLSETLRQGVFGLNPSEITAMSYAALLLCALIVLRTDFVFVLRRPRHPLYGHARLNWTWPRTLLAMVLGVLLLILPLAYGLTLIHIEVQPFTAETLVSALVYDGLVAAICVELFFREAAVKAFADNVGAMVLASALAYFVFHLPGGVPAAMIASGAGLFYLALRLIGANILAVAAVHAAFGVATTQVLPLALNEAEMWRYAIYFTVAAAALSLTVYSLFAPNRKELQYA